MQPRSSASLLSVLLWRSATQCGSARNDKTKEFRDWYLFRAFTFWAAFCLSFFGTNVVIGLYGDAELPVPPDAPCFSPDAISDLCVSDAGAVKVINFFGPPNQKCLTPRQACAVESAALSNADMTIHLHMSSDGGDTRAPHCRTLELLELLPNVQIVHEDFYKHFHRTPLEPLYLSGSTFGIGHHTKGTAAIGVAYVYKHGGIYLDLDMVVMRSLRCLKNTAGARENDVLIFDRGHRLLHFFMRFIAQTYRPELDSAIESGGFRKCVQMFCNVPVGNLNDNGEVYSCYNGTDVTMMYPKAFHPMEHTDKDRLLMNGFSASEIEELSDSFAVHVGQCDPDVSVPRFSLYEFIAQRFCPTIYGESITSGGRF